MSFKLPTAAYNLQSLSVYEPSEDTFLLLDALEDQLQFLIDLKPTFILEIGSGSGVNITSLSSVIPNAFYLATDINAEACKCTSNTGRRNNQTVECCRVDLFSCLRQNFFDVILFNPPYVVTENDEVKGTGIERAWAGGDSGRKIIDRFLNNLPCMLTKNGVCYLVIIKENNPEEMKAFVNILGFHFEIIKERKVRGEHLFIVKIQR